MEEDGYGTLTNLIFTAVDRELSNEYVHVQAIEELKQSPSEAPQEMVKEISELRKEMEELREAVLSDGSEYDESEVKEVALSVQEQLSGSARPLSVITEEVKSDPMVEMEVNEELVREALLYLESNKHTQVDSHFYDGRREWFDGEAIE